MSTALVPASNNSYSSLNVGPVGSLSTLGTPLITPAAAALNPPNLPISTSLFSLGAIAAQPAPSAWGMSAAAAPYTAIPSGIPSGTAPTLACALARQQKETRDLVLKRTGKVRPFHLSTRQPTMVLNKKKHRKRSHLIIHFPTSEEVSE